MESGKRLIIAIALSVLVILGYQSYMRKFDKPYHKRITTQTTTPRVDIKQQEERRQKQAQAEKEFLQKAQDSTPEKTTTMENQIYRAILTNRGAAIKELALLSFADKTGEPIPLYQPKPGLPLVLEITDTTSAATTSWSLAEKTNSSLTYRAEDQFKVVRKTITFDNYSYTIGLELNIKNKTDLPYQTRYKIIGGPAVASAGYIDKRYIGGDIQIGEKIYRRSPSSKTIQGGEIFYGAPVWASTRSRYFSFVLKPEQREEAGFIESPDKKEIWSGIMLGPISIAPHAEITHRYTLYAGSNDLEEMAVLGPTSNNIISYGMFGGIAKLMFKALAIFYKISGNYGLAIMILALVISTIMFPLTRKSMRSMKEMQKIQPEVEKIKKEYADNSQKQQKETMELYKRHKINPVGGCLPILLQLPIFLSLYQVLLRSVELKGANFLWIKDLSEPDAAFKFPQTIPILGNYINILPILMALAMFMQQKISQPKGTKVSEQQRMMMIIMPVMFAFIFYNLPSGLVLYWFTNTLLTILGQEVILKSH